MRVCWLLVIVFIPVLFACSKDRGCECGPQVKEHGEYNPGSVVAAVARLNEQAGEDCGDKNVKPEFDACSYFNVLTRLCPPEGEVLDYFMDSSGGDGYPVLYLRKKNARPYANRLEYAHTDALGLLSFHADPAYEKFRLDGTPESYFELVVFMIMGGQFCLKGHANYNDTVVVTSSDDVKALLGRLTREKFCNDLPLEAQRSALKLDVSPHIKFLDKGRAEVLIVTFTKWGGFMRRRYVISRTYPHRFLHEKSTALVEFDCGVKF